jgi:hypothetical protein
MKLRMPSEFLLVEYLVKLQLSGVARWLSLFLINYKHQKLSKKQGKTSRVPGIERFIPDNGAKMLPLYRHLGDVEEIFNPEGSSLFLFSLGI